MKVPTSAKLILLLIIPLLAMSCTDDSFTLGSNFFDDNIRTVYIDTCTVRMNTVDIDSLETSGKGLLMTGRYSDTLSGKTVCSSYITFSLPLAPEFPESTPVIFDSINLNMTLNGDWEGDTTLFHSFNIYSLTELIELPDFGIYYSTMSVAHSPETLTTFTIKPEPAGNDLISVRLPDQIGIDLLKAFHDQDESIVGTQDRFMNYFKGIAIEPGEYNNSILGFSLSDTTMHIRLYYHYVEEDRTEKHIVISPLQERCFFGVTSDRSGTPFNNLKSNELSSSSTGNIAMVQALTASFVRFEMPFINNLLEIGDFGTIMSASLKIFPVKGTYSDEKPLPPVLSMYVSDENDITTGYITSYSGEALQTGSLVIDNFMNTNTCYTFDISDFMNEQLGVFGINKKNLTLALPDEELSTSLYTLVLGDSNRQENNIELQITYFIYDDK